MGTKLLTTGIWPRIKKLCASGPGYVAVAYLGRSGRKLLPLKAGSVLVVDASEGAVKQGQTSPAELIKFVRAGVDVHSAPDLHAKVFAFPKAVLVGSTNVSNNSASHWQEAAVESADPKLIKHTREFVLDLAGEPLPLARLQQLQKLYRPPTGGPKLKGQPKLDAPQRSPLWLAEIAIFPLDDEERAQTMRGIPVAKARLRAHQQLESFAWDGASVRRVMRGDQMVQVVSEGKRIHVHPVATVVERRLFTRRRRGATSAIVFLAVPKGKSVLTFADAKRRLGVHAEVLTEFADHVLVRGPAAQAIRQLWRPR